MFERTTTGSSCSISAGRSSRISGRLSAASTFISSAVDSFKKRFGRRSSMAQTPQVLAGTSEPTPPIDTSYRSSPYPTSAPVTPFSPSCRSGSDFTQITPIHHTSATSSPPGAPYRRSRSSDSGLTYSTYGSTPPASVGLGHSQIPRIWSPTNGFPSQSAKSLPPSPQGRRSSIFASSSTGSSPPTSPVFSQNSPVPQSSPVPDLVAKWSPTHASSPYEEESFPIDDPLISSCSYPASPPIGTRTGNFYTEYSGIDAPSSANGVATEGYGSDSSGSAFGSPPRGYTGVPRGDGRDTPPPSHWTRSSA